MCEVTEFWRGWLVEKGWNAAAMRLDGRDAMGYLNENFRRRYRKAQKAGFTARMMTAGEWNARREEVFQINTSTMFRQGMIMRKPYREPVAPTTDKPTKKLFGVFDPVGVLVGYICGSFVGTKLAASSQILGHAEVMKQHGIMVMCYVEFLKYCIEIGSEVVVYSCWTDGTDGLRYFKQSIGMQQMNLSKLQL